MLTNRERVIQTLTQKSAAMHPSQLGIAAQAISDQLKIQRSTVSLYLNEMVRNGDAIKINTRPVYFFATKVYQAEPQKFRRLKRHFTKQQQHQQAEDPFSHLIGADSSLKTVVNQVKSAVIYPPNGMPCLLVGESGVGKSFIARLAFEYAKQAGYVKGELVVLNCAEYADNPELLSSILFGHVKGAFTGADQARRGLLTVAKDGYLFLDEVHRLAPESQEKLFQYMDKGTYRPVGETSTTLHSNARLIFATTEQDNIDFLQTFLRRIPMMVQIPSFHSRTKPEKLDLIATLFLNEAKLMQRNLNISAEVVQMLLTADLAGNVGKLQSIVKLTCAECLLRHQHHGRQPLTIKIVDLPTDFLNSHPHADKDQVATDAIEIDATLDHVHNVKIAERSKLYDFAMSIIAASQKLSTDTTVRQQVFQQLATIANAMSDYVSFDLKKTQNAATVELLETTIKSILGNFYLNFGVNRFNSNAHLLALIILYIHSYEDDRVVMNLSETLLAFKQQFGKRYQLCEQLTQAVHSQLDLQNSELYQLLIFNFIFAQQKQLIPIKTNAVIVAHGYSTASSIATTVNRLLKANVFESVDMPLDAGLDEVVVELQRYFTTINPDSNLLLLVDMGSLMQLQDRLADSYEGQIMMMTNVSTSSALTIGQELLSNHLTAAKLTQIADTIRPQTKFIDLVQRPKVILTTCITGIGAAKYLQQMVWHSTGGKLQVITKDFYQLQKNGQHDSVFKDYNVKIIIGTDDPGVPDVPYLSVEDLINPQVGNRVFLTAFPGLFNPQKLATMNAAMVRAFTLDNIASNLTILNPANTVVQVEQCVKVLERSLGVQLDVYLRISLYMHLCFMVERIVQQEPNLDYHDIEQFQNNHQHFIQIVLDALSEVQHYYNIQIPVSEVGFIYDILHERVDLKNID